MLFDLTQKAAPTVDSIAARPKAIVIKGLFTDDDQHAYFKGYRYLSEADALADTDSTDLDDEVRNRKYRDDDDLVAGTTYWYRFSSVDSYDNESAKSVPVSATYRGVLDNDRDQTPPGPPGTPTLTNAPGDYDDDDGSIENGLLIETTVPTSGRTPRKYFVQIWRRPKADGAGTADSLDGYTKWRHFTMWKTSREFRANPRFYHKAQVTPITANDIWGTPSDVTPVGVRPSRGDSAPDAPSAINQRNRGDRTIVYVPKTDDAFDDPRFVRVDWHISPTIDFDDPGAEDKKGQGNNQYPLDDYDAGDTVYVWARYRLKGGKVSSYFPDEGDDGQEINIATVEDGSGEWGLGTASTLDFDTDGTLAANSDAKIATQKAVKTYVTAHAGAGDVVGPSSATDSAPAVFDGTTGKLIKEVSYSTFKTSLVLVKGDVGLGSVVNLDTSDMANVTFTSLSAAAAVSDTDTLPVNQGAGNLKQNFSSIKTWIQNWLSTASLTWSGKTLTTPTINGAAVSGTWSGTPTWTGVQTISRGVATSAVDYLVLKPTDFTTNKPQLGFTKSATAIKWTIGLWDGSSSTGTIDISASAFTWNGSALVDLSSSQTLTSKTIDAGSNTITNIDTTMFASGVIDTDGTLGANSDTRLSSQKAVKTFVTSGTITMTNKTLTSPTINGATISGTWAGSSIWTGVQTISRGTATATSDYLVLKPTDYATGKPQIAFTKDTAATRWILGLWDGTNNSGTLDLSASALTWNSNTLFTTANDGSGSGLDGDLLDGQHGSYYLDLGNATGTLADARLPSSLTGKTFTSLVTHTLGTATSSQDYETWKPSDYGTGKPALNINKDATASKWNIGLWDGTNTNGTININCSTFSWNSVQIVDLSTAQTLTNKSLSDSTTFFVDNADATKKLQFQISGIATATTRTVTWPDSDVTITTAAATLLDDTSVSAMRTTLSISAANTPNTPAGNIAATDVQAAINELDTEKLALAGGSMTGALTIGQDAGALTTHLNINQPAGTARRIIFETASSFRWFVQAGAGLETGSNAGSDFEIVRRSDTGTNLGNALVITRANGVVTMASGIGGAKFVDASDVTKVLQFTTSGIATGTTRTATWPDASGTVVLDTATQTLSGKALVDSSTTIVDDGDNTKVGKFQLSGVATATTVTVNWPASSGTMSLTDVAETISAVKTFTSNPIVQGASGPLMRVLSTKNGTWATGEVIAGLTLEGSDASGVGAGVRGAVRALASGSTGGNNTLALYGSSAALDQKFFEGNEGLLWVAIGAVPTFADDTAAGVGGLTQGRIYKTATGQLMIKL